MENPPVQSSVVKAAAADGRRYTLVIVQEIFTTPTSEGLEITTGKESIKTIEGYEVERIDRETFEVAVPFEGGIIVQVESDR